MPTSSAAGAPSRPGHTIHRSLGAKGSDGKRRSARRPRALASLPAWCCFALLLVGAGDATGQDGGDLEALSRDPGQWVMAPKNYASTRFSGLDQINTENVERLQLAWSLSVGVNRGQEAAPLIVDGTMYVVGPRPNNLFALDATTRS
jgi:glucose dehydrogenase